MQRKPTLGVVVGNRGFFPGHLCEQGRAEILRVLEAEGYDAVALTPDDTPYGSVETRPQARQCADLFKKHADRIDGILVTLPNFGDERGVAETLKMADLNVPVLVHAFPDNAKRMSIADRRDSFCGKLSVCNNLRQYGIKYSITGLHTVAPDSDAFKADLKRFVATCRVVKGLRSARLGAIGARPAAFNTVRYSEKILQATGITVETLDLSEVLGRANKMSDSDAPVAAKIEQIRAYIDTETGGIPASALGKMARLAVTIQDWIDENELTATAVQCWTAIEEFYGVVPCTVMSMLSNQLLPSACEVDITGAIGMYALTLAAGSPAALLDWNNNYGDDPDKCVVFHCSNLPKGILQSATMGTQDIIGGTVGLENTYGTVNGTIRSGSFTFSRVATDDVNGQVRAYVGEGNFTSDLLSTFGGVGVAHIPGLQNLLQHLCENGFEHHVAASHGQVADALNEAMGKYLGWSVYRHKG